MAFFSGKTFVVNRGRNNREREHRGKNKQVPQDFADYIVERDYVMAALRTMKDMDADQEDWKRMVEEFIARKKEQNGD